MISHLQKIIAVLAAGILTFQVSCLTGHATPAAGPAGENARTVLLLDPDWRFFRGGALGAENPAFDDASWRSVDLPHDWSIEDLPATRSPFQPDAVGQVSAGFTTGGTGWYRKTFVAGNEFNGKRAYLLFEGVYMNSDVWLNGQKLGNHPYGYTSFWFDVTDMIRPVGNNVLAVQVKNEGANSRWYSGSGIYRHVWLTLVNPVHIAPWGTVITTPEISTASARVKIMTTLKNTTAGTVTAELVTVVKDRQGNEKAIARTREGLEAGKQAEFAQEAFLTAPELWSVDSPVLYSAVTSVYVNGEPADVQTASFGIRTAEFTVDRGFLLNGKSMEIKGGCVHHDNGPLGSRAFDRAEERRVELLKSSGFNAIRCAHNPPSPAFLEACDRLGMLVIDEAFDMWVRPNNPYDYHLYFDDWWQHDISSMVLRDRNHPSIILWSIGNEIQGMDSPEIVAVARKLGDFVRSLDPTRPVTAAVNSVTVKKDPFFSALDVAGYNYARNTYVTDHERMPGRIMFATESFPLEAYDYWMDVVKYPWVIGDFVWTSFDYIGEASIGWRGYMQEKDFYPWTLAYCGDIDICGWKRPQSYYRDILWNTGNPVSIFVRPPEPSFPPNPKREAWSIWHWDDVVADWNWSGYENRVMDVVVYAATENVELFLNGKSLGKKPAGMANRYTATWQVPYQPGELKAVGTNKRSKLAEILLETAGKPVSLKLTCDRQEIMADGQDLSYITVELTDENGRVNPKAGNPVEFSISGPGTIAGVGNADPMSTESYQLPGRKAWRGKCLVIVRSRATAGEITLKATSAGIRGSEITIRSVR